MDCITQIRNGETPTASQLLTCYQCLKNFCGTGEDNVMLCQKCCRNYCNTCIDANACHGCGNAYCETNFRQHCMEFRQCEDCRNEFCESCYMTCDYCFRNRCIDCSTMIECQNSTCKTRNCVGCEKDWIVTAACDDCGCQYCSKCLLEKCLREHERGETPCQSCKSNYHGYMVKDYHGAPSLECI